MKTPRPTGIGQQVTDRRPLVGSYEDPDHPERVIDPEIARLSGGLFDGLPDVQIPLDSFFPLGGNGPEPPPAPRPESAPPATMAQRPESEPPPVMVQPPESTPPAFEPRAESAPPAAFEPHAESAPPAAMAQRPESEPPPAFEPHAESEPPPAFVRRFDSLYPIETDLAHPPPGVGHSPAWRWSGGLAMVAAAGALVAVALLRPPAPPATPAAATLPPVGIALPDRDPEPARAAAVPAPEKARPATPPVLRGALPKPVERGAATLPPARAEAVPVAPPAPPAAPAEPVLAPSPPAVVDPLLRPDLYPPGLPTERAVIAIAAAARGASSCLDPDDPRRTMAVSVTFAPSGQVTRATVDGGPHRGTAAGSCIAQRLRTAVVKPFDGSPTIIRTSVTVR